MPVQNRETLCYEFCNNPSTGGLTKNGPYAKPREPSVCYEVCTGTFGGLDLSGPYAQGRNFMVSYTYRFNQNKPSGS